MTTVKELIKYLETLKPETEVKVVEIRTGYENYGVEVPLVIEENSDYYAPTLFDRTPELLFGETR